MIAITPLEAETLRDICRGVNVKMHDKKLYAALEQHGLIAKTLSGHWSSTAYGRRYEMRLFRPRSLDCLDRQT